MKSAAVGRARAVGVGWRREIAADLLREPRVVDLVEVVAEMCFTQTKARREARAVAELWPVVPHGVKLSLGSADGIDRERARALGALARELRAPVVTEHVAFTRAGAHDVGHLTQLPRTREAVRVLARNVERARRELPDVPLLLENAAWTVLWPDDEMDEASFYVEVVRATGCGLLLDVANLYANARNEGRDPFEVLARYPLEHVEMAHVAGGIFEDDFYFDTHAHPVDAGVLEVLARLLAHRPETPVILERDAGFGSFAELRAELDAVRAIVVDAWELAGGSPLTLPLPALRAEGTGVDGSRRGLAARHPLPERGEDRGEGGDATVVALGARQEELARLLTDAAAPAGPMAAALGARQLERARGILRRKRVEDALPLLGRLSSRGSPRLREVAEHALCGAPRPARGAGPLDARRIARAALGEPALRDDALVDLLTLRARFGEPDRSGGLSPRFGPFVGTERLANGARVMATKGFGAHAEVRLHEGRRS